TYARVVAFRPDGRTLASLGDNSEIILWDVLSGKQSRIFKGKKRSPQEVCFSPDGRWLRVVASNRAEGEVATLWDLIAGRLRSTVGFGDGSYLFSADSKKLIYAGESGGSLRKRRLITWDIEGEKVE